MRYPLSDTGSSQDRLLEMWSYEARRLFRDRLVGEKALDHFDAILNSVLRSDWSTDSSSLEQEGGTFYVTWGSHHGSSDNVGTQFGKPLGRLSAADMQEVVAKAIVAYGRCTAHLHVLTHIHIIPMHTILPIPTQCPPHFPLFLYPFLLLLSPFLPFCPHFSPLFLPLSPPLSLSFLSPLPSPFLTSFSLLSLSFLSPFSPLSLPFLSPYSPLTLPLLSPFSAPSYPSICSSFISIPLIVPLPLPSLGREYQQLDILLFHEVLDHIARIDRVLTSPGGSLLLSGRSGVGRHTAVSLVAHMHQMEIITPHVSRNYHLKQFKNDLKNVSHQR